MKQSDVVWNEFLSLIVGLVVREEDIRFVSRLNLLLIKESDEYDVQKDGIWLFALDFNWKQLSLI